MAKLIKADGLIGNSIQLGKSATARKLIDDTLGLKVTANNGSTAARLIIARPDMTTTDQATTVKDLKERVVPIAVTFSDASGYTPEGGNDGSYLFCHTGGSNYAAGAVYSQASSTLTAVPLYDGMMITTNNGVTATGSVNLISNGLYVRESTSWYNKGDGTAVGDGIQKTISMSLTASSSYFTDGTTKANVSTATVPTGAIVERVVVDSSTPITNGTVLTVAVTINSQTVMAAGDSDIALSNIYINEPGTVIASSSVVTVTTSNATIPSTGGPITVTVYYSKPLA